MKAKELLSFALIIPTYNGREKVSRLLTNLLLLEYIPDEVIVVIDGSEDGTIEAVSSFKSHLTTLQICKQSNKGRSISRNVGAKMATSKILLFMDDDMIPDEKCFGVHLTHHGTFSGTLATGPQFNVSKGSPFDDFRVTLSEKWHLDSVSEDDGSILKKAPFVTAANFSIERDLFVALGGFDEELTDAEDLDLAYRAATFGHKCYYLPSAVGYHFDGVDLKGYIRRLRQYRSALYRLEQLKPQLYSKNIINRVTPPSGLKALFFRCFASENLINFMGNEILSGMIPSGLRNRIFDLVVTANGSYFVDIVEL